MRMPFDDEDSNGYIPLTSHCGKPEVCMKLWMDVMRDIEHVMDDYERLFDAWASGACAP